MINLGIVLKFIILRFIYYFDNIRVFDWRAYIGIALLGFVRSVEASPSNMLIYRTLRFTVTLIFYLAFTFSINNCFDIKCDAHKEAKIKRNPIAAGHITFREGLILSLCMAFTGLVLSYLWFDENCFLVYFMMLLLGGAYSAPPLRLKSVPLMDLLSHSLFFGALLYLYGLLSNGGINLQAASLAASVSLYSIILELRNHLEDYEADLNSETRTTVCCMGYSRSRRLLRSLIIVHYIFLTAISYPSGNLSSSLVLISAILAASKLLNLRFNHLVRLTDLYTCIMYILISSPMISPLLNLG